MTSKYPQYLSPKKRNKQRKLDRRPKKKSEKRDKYGLSD